MWSEVFTALDNVCDAAAADACSTYLESFHLRSLHNSLTIRLGQDDFLLFHKNGQNMARSWMIKVSTNTVSASRIGN